MRATVFVALIGLIGSACRGNLSATKTPTAVRVREVERSSSSGGLRYAASINAASRVDLAFKLSGYVETVATVRAPDGSNRIIQEGDHVTSGQELAALRKSDTLQKQAEAKAALAEAQASRRQAQIEFARSSRLVASGSVARADLDSARVRLASANARVEAARARVDEAQTAVSDAVLRAPMDGIVLKRSVEVGTLATPGVIAFSIADTKSVKVVFGVADVELEGLRVGASQAVTTEAHRGRSFVGRVTRIAPAADARSRVFEVEVTIPNTDQLLKPGMIASLKVDTPIGAAPMVALPLNAIVRSPAHADKFAVFVVQAAQTAGAASTAKLREVEVGDFVGNNIMVHSGLDEHDRVIVMGAALVADGEAVQVIP